MKVDVAIIGMQKCGTTFLKSALEQHKDIQCHPQTEMTFYYDDDEYLKGSKSFHRYFPNPEGNRLKLIKHSTLIRSQDALDRLLNHNPDCKLIVCLRNPVERAFSSFLMDAKYSGDDAKQFKEAVIKACLQDNWDGWRQKVYIGLGKYYEFLKILYERCPQEQIKLISFDDIQSDSKTVTEDILTWLCLSIDNLNIKREKRNSFTVTRYSLLTKLINWIRSKDNGLKVIAKSIMSERSFVRLSERVLLFNERGARKPPFDPEIREILSKYYKPYNQILMDQYHVDTTRWF